MLNKNKMDITELRKEALRLIDSYPHKSEEIRSYYQLALDEIEDGGSVENECHLAWSDMLECINE